MAAVGGISLFKSGRGGNIRARWGKGKHRVDFNTGTKNEQEALERAAEELRRRTGSSAAPLGTPTPRPAAAAPPSPQPPADAPPAPSAGYPASRRPLGDALARVLIPSSPAPGGAMPPSGNASLTPAPAAVVPDAVMSTAQAEVEKAAVEKVRQVHKVVGKACTYGLEGCLKRMCRWAGREPEDIDDDEEALMREGFEELAAKYLGTKKISPAGKVLAGGIAAGFGMYMAGKEIPKPKPAPAPLQLVKQPAPEGDGGGKSA